MITRQSPKPVSKDQLEKVSEMLQELPPKPKDELSLKEAIAEMYEKITAALNRGYSHAEISEVLKGQGLQISSSTLKSYLAQVKPSDAPKRAKQPRKAKAEASSDVVDATSELDEPEELTASEPPKRGRKTATSAKTAAKATAKPATLALDVPVDSEPPKRGRKAATATGTATKQTSRGEGSGAVKTSTRRRSTIGRGRREQG